MASKKIPTIHQTDLFHHFNDPDDHWDIASQYALAYLGDIDLKGILIDHPSKREFGDPAIASVSQLNVITGEAVPIGVGCEMMISSEEDIREIALTKPLNSGINMLLGKLEESDEPVVIHIVGSARDVAAAVAIRPQLFEKKCKAIYLNAGFSRGEKLEWNVELDPFSYSKLFKAPCPLYWMPCFHEAYGQQGTHGTFWRFRQNEILPHLSRQMKNYFSYALSRSSDHRWLSYLKADTDQDWIDALGKQNRNMWCTAGFLHAVGKTVLSTGEIVDIDASGTDPVFDFIPISVSCRGDGRTEWIPSPSRDRFIFKVLDPENYAKAMTSALKQLLCQLP